MQVLIALGGLPGTGKSTIARQLAHETGAVWLRIDSIEQAIQNSGVLRGEVDDAGYRVAYAVAEDNLRLGRDVIADSVNGWLITRDAWRDAAARSGAKILEVETICSDLDEHRRRVETRSSDVVGLRQPDWAAVLARDCEPWDRDHLVVDTAKMSVAQCVELIRVAKPRLP